MQRLCDAKDKLLEAREAEKQQLEEMLEQRLSDLGISPEQLYDNGTAEKQEMVCRTSYLVIAGSHKCDHVFQHSQDAHTTWSYHAS